eukprot:1897690-Rhodomonas_salina.1
MRCLRCREPGLRSAQSHLSHLPLLAMSAGCVGAQRGRLHQAKEEHAADKTKEEHVQGLCTETLTSTTMTDALRACLVSGCPLNDAPCRSAWSPCSHVSIRARAALSAFVHVQP